MNNVSLIGRLCRDVESRTTTNGASVCTFTLAVNRRFKQDGQPEADFLPVVAWGKTSEFCGKYFRKGQQVWVQGRIQTRTWDDTEGKKHYVTEVVAEAVGFADSKKDSGENESPSPQQPANGYQGQQQSGGYVPPSSPPPSGGSSAFPWERKGGE
jgi:single-strand DNA-binding protein